MGNLTYEGENFYIDGEKVKIYSGTMHYFRIPCEYWHDRLLKLKECGFNTVETYTCWNLHEPQEGKFDFSGNLDIGRYIDEAKKVGLNVIVRPGPYICAEWEFGGFPAWILKYENVTLRCFNDEFISMVRRYYKELLSYIRPRLASNGGNVIMIQVENEYGSYGDDKDYLREIANIYKENGIDCLFFTSDGPCYNMLTGGTLDEYLCVANFGSDPATRFEILKDFRPNQPLMCGEYWCGWFDHWFEEHHTRSAKEICDDFENFFKVNASFNFYMFCGGTNFGFMNGANYGDTYEPTVTSYDYCAPLSEAGDRTETYYAVREVIKKYTGSVPKLTAKESTKAAYGKIALSKYGKLFDNLDNLTTKIRSASPKFMEDYGQNYGYILYRTVLTGPREVRKLSLEDVHDRAQIFIDGELRGIYERWNKEREPITIDLSAKGSKCNIDVLVENMGRVNYGPKLRDRKGISAVKYGGYFHFGYDVYCLPMEDLSKIDYKEVNEQVIDGPVFLKGEFNIEGIPADTFVALDGFHKGFIRINGFNLGRFFNDAGPQRTLYVPAPVLKSGNNIIEVFESDKVDSPFVEFFDKPDLG